MVRESLNHQIKHLVSLQYSTVEIRHQALLDVLAGPYGLHEQLPSKLAEVNAFRKQFTDAQLHADPDTFPPVRRTKPPRKGKGPGTEIPGPALAADHRRARADPPAAPGARAVQGAPRGGAHRDGRQVVPPGDLRLGDRVDERRRVRRALPARPRALPRAAPQDPRDPRRSCAGEWPRLAAEYRAALGDITSPEAWEETFAALDRGRRREAADD